MSPTPLVIPTKGSASHPFFIAKMCFYKRINILGVYRGNCYAYYEYSSGKFHWHECQCQIQITESHLTPHYAVYSERRKDHVIFVYNYITAKIEQYILNETTGGLEQVNCSELVYDSNLMVRGTTVATLQNGKIVLEVSKNGGIRKLSHSFGQWVEVPRIAVKTLRDPPQENQTSTTYPTTNTYPSTYFHIDKCPDARIHVTLDGSSFHTYQYSKGDFFSCQPCPTCPNPNILMDSQLIPRYCTFSKQHKTHVIFARNTVTVRVGKYIYTNQGFKEVNYSDVVYDPSVILQSQTLCLFEKGTVVVYQNRSGSLSVDRWDTVEGQFRMVPSKRVLTLAGVKRGEVLEGSKGSKNSKESEDSEDTKASGDLEDLIDPNDSEDFKGSKDSDDSEDPEDSGDSKDSKDSGNSEDSGDSKDPKDTKDSGDSEDSENSDAVKCSKDHGYEVESSDSEDSELSDDSDVSILDSEDSADSKDSKDTKDSDGSEASSDSEASNDSEDSGEDSEDSDDSDVSIVDPLEVRLQELKSQMAELSKLQTEITDMMQWCKSENTIKEEKSGEKNQFCLLWGSREGDPGRVPDPWILGSLGHPGDLDPGDLDPGDLDPGDLDPGGLDPGDLDPGDLDPGDLDPGDLDPGDLDPGDLDPGDLDPGDLDSGDLDPGDLDPGDLDPGDLDPGDLDLGDLDPGDLDPGYLDPGDLDPGDLDPGDLVPGDLDPGGLDPGDLDLG